MAHGVIKSIFMRAFVEGALYLDLPHIYTLYFPNPFINHLSSPLYRICKFPFIRFQAFALLFGIGVSTERVELKFGLDFISPFFYHSFLSLSSFSYYFRNYCKTTFQPLSPLLMRG